MGGSITTWYFRVFLVGSRSYSVIIGGSDTINGVSGRFRYKLPYLRVFLEGSRSYNVITGGFHPGASGVMFQDPKPRQVADRPWQSVEPEVRGGAPCGKLADLNAI